MNRKELNIQLSVCIENVKPNCKKCYGKAIIGRNLQDYKIVICQCVFNNINKKLRIVKQIERLLK